MKLNFKPYIRCVQLFESKGTRWTARRYQERLGWPCTAHGHAVWTLAGQSMDAVDVVLPQATRLRSALRGRGYPVVIAVVPGDPVIWRFLVAPRTDLGHGLRRELERLVVAYHRCGDLIELPPTRVPGGTLQWLRGSSIELTQVTSVIGALLRDELTADRLAGTALTPSVDTGQADRTAANRTLS